MSYKIIWLLDFEDLKTPGMILEGILDRDITAVTTGLTAVALKFSDAITLFQSGGQILPNIEEVAPIISPWLLTSLRIMQFLR